MGCVGNKKKDDGDDDCDDIKKLSKKSKKAPNLACEKEMQLLKMIY